MHPHPLWSVSVCHSCDAESISLLSSSYEGKDPLFDAHSQWKKKKDFKQKTDSENNWAVSSIQRPLSRYCCRADKTHVQCFFSQQTSASSQLCWVLRQHFSARKKPPRGHGHLRHTDRKTRFVVHKHDQAAVLFFTTYGWKQEEISLLILSVFCVCGWTGAVQVSDVSLSLSSKTNAASGKIFTTVGSTAFVHTWCYNQRQMEVPWRGFKFSYTDMKQLNMNMFI